MDHLRQRIEARTSILRTLTNYNSGASFRVKKTFYTHAIRSLIDYSAPCLVTANPTALKKLDTLQNKSLRLILSSPPWTKVLNLRAETHLPSIQTRIDACTASLVAKMRHSPRPSTLPDKVLAVTNLDRNLFRKRTWPREAASSLLRADIVQTLREKGRDTPHPDFSPAPP